MYTMYSYDYSRIFMIKFPLMATYHNRIISTLKEMTWAPFDSTEGESEPVPGFHVKYAVGPFPYSS